MRSLICLVGGVSAFSCVSAAWAGDTAAGAQGGITGLIFPIAIFVLIFYFMMYRPQKKKQQQHEKMLASISRGDKVVSIGGFYGTVSDILDDSYVVEIADGVKVRLLKSAISVRKDTPDAVQQKRRKKKRRPDAGDNEGVSDDENRALMGGETAESEGTENAAAAEGAAAGGVSLEKKAD
ncbi:hypothetical protein FACS1894167_05640 [Synergistales bacterium]|nr:hypothetical protein FACS1894167_05640 [Synergistales bacterium]